MREAPLYSYARKAFLGAEHRSIEIARFQFVRRAAGRMNSPILRTARVQVVWGCTVILTSKGDADAAASNINSQEINSKHFIQKSKHFDFLHVSPSSGWYLYYFLRL